MLSVGTVMTNYDSDRNKVTRTLTKLEDDTVSYEVEYFIGELHSVVKVESSMPKDNWLKLLQ